MERNDSVIKTIDTVLNDKNYLLSILDERQSFNEEHLFEMLALTIDYYILTRYSNFNLSPQEIRNDFEALNRRVMTNSQIKNVIDHGYLTHAFNGIEKEYVEKYGFDYFDKLPEEEQRKFLRIRLGLKKLESEIGKNLFQTYREEENDMTIVDKELFVSIPGTKSVFYAKDTPERFYFGPVGRDSFAYFPMIIGESKSDYLKRILTYRIENMTYKIEPQRLIDIADGLVDYYTKEPSMLAFIPIETVIDKPVYSNFYGQGDGGNLKRFCEMMKNGRYYPCHAFTTLLDDEYENPEDKGNLVLLSTDVKPEDISFSRFPDIYNLKQTYLKEKGLKDGTLVDYYSCKEIEKDYYIPSTIKRYYKGI